MVCLPRGEMDWSPPTFALSTPPATKEIFHLDDGQNFARTARWSPDGSVFLAQSENRSLQLFNSTSTLFPQPAPILDFLWYPAATPHDPASFCFLSSVRECPVKLIDASDGRVCLFLPSPPHLMPPTAPRILPNSRPPRTSDSTPRPCIQPLCTKVPSPLFTPLISPSPQNILRL